MTITDPSKPEPDSAEAIEPDEPRKTRGIRFSRCVWEEIKAAAERHDVAAAEFVRTTCLDAARDATNVGADTQPPRPTFDRGSGLIGINLLIHTRKLFLAESLRWGG